MIFGGLRRAWLDANYATRPFPRARATNQVGARADRGRAVRLTRLRLPFRSLFFLILAVGGPSELTRAQQPRARKREGGAVAVTRTDNARSQLSRTREPFSVIMAGKRRNRGAGQKTITKAVMNQVDATTAATTNSLSKTLLNIDFPPVDTSTFWDYRTVHRRVRSRHPSTIANERLEDHIGDRVLKGVGPNG